MLNNHYSPKLGVRAFFHFIEKFSTLHKLNLTKMQIPFMCVLDYTLTHNDCLATIGVCVFCALTSVGALFILRRNIWEKLLK